MSAGDYLTVAQVAARLAVSKMTVYRMLADGTLPHLTAGPRGRRVLSDDVEAYIAAQTVGAPLTDRGRPQVVRAPGGGYVSTNAPNRQDECIEVVMAYDTVIGPFERWLDERGLALSQMPSGEDSLPTYVVTYIDTPAPLSRGTLDPSGSEPGGTETP